MHKSYLIECERVLYFVKHEVYCSKMEVIGKTLLTVNCWLLIVTWFIVIASFPITSVILVSLEGISDQLVTTLKLSAHYTKADNSATGYAYTQGYIM